jgi:hypothetical protein
MGTVFLVLLALGVGWMLRRQLAVLVVIAYSLLTVETESRATEREMRRTVRRWRRGT